MIVTSPAMYAVCTFTFLLSPLAALRAADVNGKCVNPNDAFGKGTNYRLVGDTTFGWKTGTLLGDIDLNSHALEVDTGGGNLTVISGAISGTGSMEWSGGGVPQVSASVLDGDKPNTFHGTFTLSKGVLDLDKPAGVDAIPGDLVIGAKGNAMIRLDNPNQINDASNVTLAGNGVSWLDMQGHDEKFASLTLKTHGLITMGKQPASLIVGDSSNRPWDLAKTLTIGGFNRGNDKLVFGTDDKGLTKAQLTRIGFASPVGLPEGLYTAKIGRDGQLSPDAPVQAIHPRFDVSPQAVARRRKLYDVPGLANIAGKTSPLKDGMRIDFFGDSITWLNGYIGTIDKALKDSKEPPRKIVKLINRGINGGGILQTRDGAAQGGYPGSSAQDPFAKVIAADKADLAVVYIGINDVWWRKTAPDVFEKALRDLVASAHANKTKILLATLSVHGELPNGKNGDDAKIEQFAEITRKVARDTATTLVDLRAAYIAYLQNNNAELRVDGSIYSKPTGILTRDGVHPSQRGADLLANLLSDGIVRSLAAKD